MLKECLVHDAVPTLSDLKWIVNIFGGCLEIRAGELLKVGIQMIAWRPCESTYILVNFIYPYYEIVGENSIISIVIYKNV